ncbi:hypothetical protein [Methanoculleus sp.]|jgi:hypothetical protein|uniref:hypothetical protein n=1 Tax=Methanoculleus sp. TaxID=90427 RepID=UPI00260F6900|nr:hypothetical protein [Methanoculleus sp.]MDD2255480.1 hypothetical protein [Methanoculleus sp.]
MRPSPEDNQVYLDPDAGSIVVGTPFLTDAIMLLYDTYRRGLAMQDLDEAPTAIPLGVVNPILTLRPAIALHDGTASPVGQYEKI